MLKVNILDKSTELLLFAKGEGHYNRTMKLHLTDIDGEHYMCFDTAEGEYGVGTVRLKDLKLIIDGALETSKSRAKVVGKLKQPYNIGNRLFPTGSEVYNSDNVYYLKQDKNVYFLSNPNIREIIDLI